ncbi:glycoside hydrolase family 78 protein [Subtercola frigoramans]|uniref:glycoside hydrolase family 78 protein n=1 Tax=Subtercola frigoramans TaxID=120298 RepID=UPI00336D6AB9
MIPAPTRLRYDNLDEAIGVGPEPPRVSWLIGGEDTQLAHEIQSTLSDRRCSSGRVESAECAFVPWSGPLPDRYQRIEWRVRVWTCFGLARHREGG